MGVRAGKLRHKVTLQRVSEARDAVGEPVPTWATFAIRWASVESLSGREYFISKQEYGEVSHRIRLRYDSVVNTLVPKDRILHNGKTYEVEAVLPDNRNRAVVVMAKESV